jgi:hypothetical protein
LPRTMRCASPSTTAILPTRSSLNAADDGPASRPARRGHDHRGSPRSAGMGLAAGSPGRSVAPDAPVMACHRMSPLSAASGVSCAWPRFRRHLGRVRLVGEVVGMGKEIGARSGWDEPEGKKRTSQSRGVFPPWTRMRR